MADDPIQLLEDELVRAAERQARAAERAARATPLGAQPPGAGDATVNGAALNGPLDGRALARARRRLGLAAGAVAVLVPLAIGLGALALLHGRGQGARGAAGAGGSAPTPIALLAVFRRPQTSADLTGASEIARYARARGLQIDRALLRRVSVHLAGAARLGGARRGGAAADTVKVSVVVGRRPGGGWGVALVYVPSGWFSYAPLASRSGTAAVTTITTPPPPSTRATTATVATTPQASTASTTATATVATTPQASTASTTATATATVATTPQASTASTQTATARAPAARLPSRSERVLPAQLMVLGPFYGPAALAGGRIVQDVGTSITGSSEVVVLVPDGVARVSFRAPGLGAISASVNDNLAGFLVPGRRFAADPAAYRMTWYAPGGQVVRVVDRS